MTPKRPRRLVETDEYEAFIRHILHVYARRVGGGDIEALALMLGLAEEIDTAIADAVKGQLDDALSLEPLQRQLDHADRAFHSA